MLDTKKFRTRQEFVRTPQPKGRDYIIGLDIGYSATKVFHENGHFVFPSYVKSISSMVNIASPKDIFYRDQEGLFILGSNAQEMVQSQDTNETDAELYGRNRYSDRRFKIICNAAIALATHQKNDERPIMIQTGLPSAYMARDSRLLTKALSSHDTFELKIGDGPWTTYCLDINEQQIHIMDQPAGALYSCLIKNDGYYVLGAKAILESNVLVMDVGFGTFDFYGFKSRQLVCRESIDDIGMKNVLKETASIIRNEYGEDIRVPALQKNLEVGMFTCCDDENLITTDIPIAPILERANEKIMKDALTKAKRITNSFRDYKYIIIDGGTGEAWYSYISDMLKGMKTVTIMPSNINDNLPFIYSNARGYYMFALNLKPRSMTQD